MKGRRFNRRLAVSTIVANMLMILITISLATVVIAWAGTTYGTFAGVSQLFFQQSSQALPEKLVIENVFFVKASSLLKTFVRNVGVEQLLIVAIYVNGTTFTFTGASGGKGVQVIIPCRAKLQPSNTWAVNETVGSVCEFDITITSMDSSCSPSPWCTGDLFYITVATARGNEAILVAKGM
jgi:hypothetical protein